MANFLELICTVKTCFFKSDWKQDQMSIDAIGSAFRFSKTYRGQTEEVGLNQRGRTKDQGGRTKEEGLKSY